MTAEPSLPLAPDKPKARTEATAEVAAILAAIREKEDAVDRLLELVEGVVAREHQHAAADRERLAAHAACSDLGKRACDVRNQLLDVYGVTP